MNEENADTGKPPDIGELQKELQQLQEEKATLQRELEERESTRHKPFPWRNLVAWILIVLATITAMAGPLASYAHDYFMDTERFVDTVAPLIREEEVAQAVSERAASTLVEELDIEQRLDSLIPEPITFISGTITGGIETLAQKAAKAILTSDQFYWVWERILRAAHSTAVSSIRGDGALELTEEGDVILDIGELLQDMKIWLVDAGLDFLKNVPVPSRAGKIVLFTSEELGIARGGVHLLDTLNWILPLVALLFFAGAVIVSTDRRKFLMAAGIGLALAMGVALIAINFSKNQILGLVEAETNLMAAQVVWSRLFRSLVQIQYGLLALGVVVAAASAVAGPYAWAEWLRGKTAHLFEAWRDRRRRGVKEPGPVGKFVESHKTALRTGGLALAVIILLLIPKVTVGAIIGVAVALVVYLALIELLRAPAPKGEPEEKEAADDDTAGPSST